MKLLNDNNNTLRAKEVKGGKDMCKMRRTSYITFVLLFISIFNIDTSDSILPPEDEVDNVLHIGGIFPIAGEGGWQGGQVIHCFHLELKVIKRKEMFKIHF